MNDSSLPKPERRWYQFSLRTLLLFTVVCGLALSWPAARLEQARKQAKSLAAIRGIDATVYYAHDPIAFRDHQFRIGPKPATTNRVPGLPWLRRLLGDDFFDRVVVVRFKQSTTTDASLAHLKSLPGIECVSLSTTWITDDGLAQLEGLTTLKSLYLDCTRVTDTGLAYLRSLVNLESLYLPETQITDAGLVHLQAMANLRILCLEGTQITDTGLAHLIELPRIEEVHLFGTKVTNKGVEELQKALPNTRIICDKLDITTILTFHIASSSETSSINLRPPRSCLNRPTWVRDERRVSDDRCVNAEEVSMRIDVAATQPVFGVLCHQVTRIAGRVK